MLLMVGMGILALQYPLLSWETILNGIDLCIEPHKRTAILTIWIYFTQGCFMFGWIWPRAMVLGIIFCQCIFLCCYLNYLPLEARVAQIESPSFKSVFVLSLVEITLGSWLFKDKNIFPLFRYYDLPLSPMSTNLNSIHPRKFGWNWLRGSEEKNENVKNLQTDDERYMWLEKADLSFHYDKDR